MKKAEIIEWIKWVACGMIAGVLALGSFMGVVSLHSWISATVIPNMKERKEKRNEDKYVTRIVGEEES